MTVTDFLLKLSKKNGQAPAEKLHQMVQFNEIIAEFYSFQIAQFYLFTNISNEK